MAVKQIPRAISPYAFEDYTHVVSRLSEEDGGGFLLTIPDLPGCISDGETIEELMQNARDAFAAWISAKVDQGLEIPAPSFQVEAIPEASGKFVQRLPKSLHARLTARARSEGVSLNTLVTALIAESLGRREASKH
jgi:predicted RNase H-like HicB family nuclease